MTAKLAEYAGVRKFRYGETDEEDQVGIVTGLAWTEFGGDILTIEAIKMPGRGRMTVTGNLKEVMKESISAAASYVRARSLSIGVKPPVFEKTDIHVHVPDGATPKDGPSAGVAMTVAMVSVLTGIPIRKDIAMTGEITLRGRVTAIGGLKEKLLAALRSGIKTVLIPRGEREGPRRRARQCEGRAGDHPDQDRRRGPEMGPDRRPDRRSNGTRPPIRCRPPRRCRTPARSSRRTDGLKPTERTPPGAIRAGFFV